ncbi:hypothetical protein Ddye_010953 [Dipteronia dyeriana]|uniref:Malectin-like domain-containing protein n=1 Tax=Dipteronia dyeriana TaxID=168575 RepID=A0AAD9XE79_9ROSI|nr:hypothetical protein Ddye_010953 [Dipteronia dyeriana]
MKNSNRSFSASVLIFVSLASAIHVIFATNYVPSEQFLLNCGESTILNDTDSRSWTPDVGSKFLLSAKSSTSKAATQDPSVPEVPYMTARVSQYEFSYSFPVIPGRKFVRLYFYSNSYNGLDATNAVFSVSSGSYTLLRNFSAAQTSEASNYAYIVKEYLIPVDGVTLTINFAPSTDASNAYAFVNGIEVMSMPDIYKSDDGTLMLVGQKSPIYIDNTIALENVYRLNVGGNDISPSGDTGLFRSWYNDKPYIYGEAFGVLGTIDPTINITYPQNMPTYVAPESVYSTARTMGPDPQINRNYNLTWIFSVDSGFLYLVRFHFCEVHADMTKINQRVFDIFLNNQTAVSGADAVGWAKHNGVPVYKDYAVLVLSGGSQQNLWLAMHPDLSTKPQYYDAILNGIEIFKLSNANGNLAGSNPIPGPKRDVVDPSLALPLTQAGNSNKQKEIIGGGLLLALAIGFCVVATTRRHRWRGKDQSPSDGPSGWLPLSVYGNSHSAEKIKSATKNFDEDLLLLGVGEIDRS